MDSVPYIQNKMGEVPSPKPEGGIQPSIPLLLSKTGSLPPSGCTHTVTVSDGVTTELPFPHVIQRVNGSLSKK